MVMLRFLGCIPPPKKKLASTYEPTLLSIVYFSLECADMVCQFNFLLFLPIFGYGKTTSNYVGHTCTILSRRLTCHNSVQSVHTSAIMNNQNIAINTRQILVDNPRILSSTQFKERLNSKTYYYTKYTIHI